MMSEGSGATYYFHYMPYPGSVSGFGTFLLIDSNYKVLSYPPQYFAAQLITKDWVQPVDAPHRQFKAASDVVDAAGNVLVTAYAVERPDKQWSVMLVNRDQYNDHSVELVFADESKRERHFSGTVARTTFGSNEYQWHQQGETGHADPDGPPSKTSLNSAPDTVFEIPKASITVLRGTLGR